VCGVLNVVQTRPSSGPVRGRPNESTLALKVSDLAIALLGCIAGFVAASTDAAPTGHPLTDTVLAGIGVGLITVIGSRASWWALAVAAVTASILNPSLIVLGVLAGAIPVALRVWRLDRPELLALSAATTFNVLIRAGEDRFFGFTSIVALLCAAAIFVTGIRRFSKRVRRAAMIGATSVLIFVVVAAAGTGYAVATARDSLSDGVRSAELGVAALEHDRFDEATEWFRRSADQLRLANKQLDRPWVQPAAFVPVLAQHRDAVVDMSATGAAGAATVADALERIDVEDLRVRGGRIDLDALAAIASPLSDVRTALDELQVSTDHAHSPWLIPKAAAVLDDFDESIDEHLPSLDNALTAIGMAPDMLGAQEPRHYLLLLTTPAESHGLGGAIESYAELTASDGVLTMTRTGRAADLDAAAQAADARVNGPAEFLDQYGRFGYEGDGGRIGDDAFRNLTMTPHFPWVGEIAASVYQQTTGRPIDGVIVADPFVISRLLSYTGPVDLPSVDQQLSVDNAILYLLHDQYLIGDGDNETHRDALAEAASVTFEASMSGNLPDPIQLATDLGPLVEQRRLLFWSAHDDEQDLLQVLGIDGAIPDLRGGDGWAFTVANGVGNKIDSYLVRRARYVSTEVDGITIGTLHIELGNTAPAEGLSRHIIGGGGRFGLPQGSSRLYLSVYSALGLDSMTVNGERVDVDAGVERGWNVYSSIVDIASGETAVVEADLAGVIQQPAEVVSWVQPMTSPLEILAD
jgi:hypothetical protein